MNFIRRLSTSRRQSDTSSCSTRSPNNEFDEMDQLPESEQISSRNRLRTLSLGNIFARRRSKPYPAESYTTDFWARNFSEKTVVSWNEFRAAFVLDYKNGLEEFSNTGHLSCVLQAAHDQLCNKDSVVYIARYKKFVGSDTTADAIWNKLKTETARRVFQEGIEDSLCL